MSLDLEMESWRQEWSVATEPLPELKRRIRAQNRRLVAGTLAIAACLAMATLLAVAHPTSGWRGFAFGVWIASLVGVGYALWARRGTWTPATQTTRAYLVLLHQRAVATLSKTVFLRRAVLVVLAAYGAFLLWRRGPITMTTGLVVAALVAESLWMRALERKRRRAVDEAARMVALGSDESTV